jgi:hypothetical protein
MSGIEQAFKDFVKRVSEKENQEQVSGERGFQYGGGAIGYSEGGFPPVEDPMIANEFRNSGIMNYPISFGNLGIRPRVDVQSGMTSSPDPYTKIKMSNQNYGADIGYQMTDNLSATGNIDYNRSNVKQDYNVPYFDQSGNKVFEDRGSMSNVYKSPINIKLGLNYQTPQTNANISVDPRSRDLMARYNYSFADGGRAFEPFYINEMTDKISNPTIGGMAGMIPTEVAGGVAGLLEAKTAKGLVDTTVKLTKKEKSYLKELMNDNGGGKFTAEILEEAPSLKISGDKLIVKQKDLKNLDKYLQDLRILEQAPSGPGANTIPPRLRDFSTDNNVVRQLYRNTPGYTGYADGGYISRGEPVDTDLTRTIPPDSGPNPQGVETLFKRRYN